MDSRMQERVTQWDSRQFAGGYDELSDLADGGFSGAVTAGNTWLFMLNGRIVGVIDGDLEAFEDAAGTAYAAPDPALPLLCTMVSQGGETRAKYYTNETPLTEVDRTLQDGSFTGYIELSERVLSGDYYAVYYGGRRMAAAYIGNAERLLTGDEAFERAAEEVGIYEVIDVDIEVTDVPTGGETSASGAEPSADAAGAAGSPADAETVESPPDDGTTDSTAVTEPTDGADETPPERPEAEPDAPGITDSGEGATEPPTPGITDEPAGAADEAEIEPAESTDERPSEPDGDEGESTDSARDERPPASDTSPEAVSAAAEKLTEGGAWEDVEEDSSDDEDAGGVADDASAGGDGDYERRLEQEAQWRQTRNIPSIDPERTTDSAAGGRTPSRRVGMQPQSITRPDREREESPTAADATADRTGGSPDSEDALESDMLEREDTIDQLTQRVEELERRRRALHERAEALETERDRVRAENQELTATVERLRTKITELESALGDAGSGSDADPDRRTQLSPREALAETNLFVRYASKSRPTLERAHEGQADREEVAENLQLEHHTGFDAADVSVVGQPYEEFLTDSMEFQFVDWLTETLLYEIRDTGRADALADLYDSIPWIDRTELDATISLADDATDDVPDAVSFDVVAFDKMGNPLIVANINDSREPATREMLAEMEEDASAVKANYPDLGAAVVVTSSYFEPGALEVTEEATSGGFLSRSSKLSYVTLSRKQGGYHLCLVEARSGGFHMTVPEL
ncbi:DUF7527 domain-containing protein [Natrononativus amylolyticus]|uniref:DUF7527 domain-containing protein n=1 Tax=Natrononativus amylolyticus TaxID=2963434 RepID=UPI0020CEF6F4|nr:transcriptional regulator [Natrononativus amylolyticus]